MRTFATLASALAIISVASAQTSTDCDPTKKDCPNNPGLNQADYSVDFSKGLPKDWTATAGSISGSSNGGQFRIAKLGDGPTIQSNWYFFYGRIEAKVQAAPGAGIVSSIVLESSDLDEVDWEWIGSETTRAQSNYFGKGNTTTYDRGGFHNVANPASTFHTYAIDWTKDAITWYIDSVAVRTLKYSDANGGRTFPQTPMNIRLGNWIGGAPGNAPGTITWAGGPVDMTKGPFDMYIQTLTVKSYNPATAYKYGDRSGSTGSIQIIRDSSVSTIAGNQETDPTTPTSSGSAASGSAANKGINTSAASVPVVPLATDAAVSVSASSIATVTTKASSNVTVPTGSVKTPTVVGASPTPSASTVKSNGASGLKVQALFGALIGVCGLFLAL